MQQRHKMRSEMDERTRAQEISSRKFSESVGFLRSSPSAKQSQHSGRRGGQSFHEWLYYTDMKWAAVRDKETKKKADEIAATREKAVTTELTFRPELQTSDKHSRDTSSRTKSVFEALYDSRCYYSDKAEMLRQATEHETLRGAVFSPKLAPGTDKLAKKWRDKEDQKMQRAPTSPTSAATAPSSPTRSLADYDPQVLTLEDISQSNTLCPLPEEAAVAWQTPVWQPPTPAQSFGAVTNPFDDFVVEVAEGAAGGEGEGYEEGRQEEEGEKVVEAEADMEGKKEGGHNGDGEEEAKEDENEKEEGDEVQEGEGGVEEDLNNPFNPFLATSHLSFFDSFIDASMAGTPQAADFFMDASFEETKDGGAFTLHELAAEQDSRVELAAEQDAKTAVLFDRLHRHDVSVALEAARRKHEKQFSHKPDIGKVAHRPVEVDPETFFARLSRRDAPKPETAPVLTIGQKPLDSQSEGDLLTRLTVKYPKRSETLRQNCRENLDKTAKSFIEMSLVSSRSEDLARRARHSSLRDIFRLLLASVDFHHKHETNETPQARDKVAEGLLDTRHAMPQLLQPKALVDAVFIVVRESCPEPLSLRAFIDAMDGLIFSGKCEPINACLSAPDRSVRRSRLADSRERRKEGHQLDLKSREVTEQLAKSRRNKERRKFLDSKECGSNLLPPGSFPR